jgi:hypothetical protein
MDHRAGLDDIQKRKLLIQLRHEPGRSIVLPVASRYTG